jgi:hypothetical protein
MLTRFIVAVWLAAFVFYGLAVLMSGRDDG